MSNVILYGRNRNLEDHTIKLNNLGYWTLGVGNTGFATGYRYWGISVNSNRSGTDYVEMTNIYFLQNSQTQSFTGVTAYGGLEGYEASNLMVDDSNVWRDNWDGLESKIFYFDFGREVTFDEIKWRTTPNSSDYDPIDFDLFGTNDMEGDLNYHRYVYYDDLTTEREYLLSDIKIDENVFFNTITPPSDGYTLYITKEREGPSIITLNDDVELLNWGLANLSDELESAEQCLTGIITSRSKSAPACLNFQHEIVTMRSCVIAVDSSFVMSYPREGTTWFNLRYLVDDSFNQINAILKPNSSLVYPTIVDSPGGKSMKFIGGGQSATFDARSPLSVTVEVYCKFEDSFRNGIMWGFENYGVICQNGYIGYTTGDLSDLTRRVDTYGFTASGLTGSYVHLVFQMTSESDSYTTNKIYVNGVEKDLFQVYGSENTSNRNFNSGNGRIGFWNGRSYSISLPFECQVFRLYNTLLTEEEISLNYSAFQSRFT